MADHDFPILGFCTKLESGAFIDTVANQATGISNEVGNQECLVLADGGSDLGVYGNFTVPQEYAGTPRIVIKGILDGAMSSVTLQFGAKGITITDNEPADAAYSSEDTGNNTDDHADEDAFEVIITLSNFSGFAAGDTVYFYIFMDASGDYGGNALVTDVNFRFADS